MASPRRPCGPSPAAVPGKPVPSRAARGGRSCGWLFARRWKRQRASAAPARQQQSRGGLLPNTIRTSPPAPSASGRRDGSSSARRSRCEGAGVERPKSASHSGAAAGRGETSSTRASSVLEPGGPGSATQHLRGHARGELPGVLRRYEGQRLPSVFGPAPDLGDRLSGAHRLARNQTVRHELPSMRSDDRFPGKDLDLCECVPRRREQPFLECGGGGASARRIPSSAAPAIRRVIRAWRSASGRRTRAIACPASRGVPDVGQPLDDIAEHGGDHGMALARLDQHRLDRQAALHAPEHRPGEEREQRHAESGQHHPFVRRRDLEPLVEGLRARPARATASSLKTLL